MSTTTTKITKTLNQHETSMQGKMTAIVADTKLRKFVTLLAACLVTAGGFLSFTAKRGDAAGTRTVYVFNDGWFVANLCIKNESKSNIEACTGKVVAGSIRDLQIPWDPGDKIIFIAAVIAGHNAYYGPIADRDTHCWTDGGSVRPKAYCRMKSEAPF